MFREKLTKNPNERGYLYIRDSYYKRDRRTLKRKKTGDGTAYKQRGKYSKKKDIYCGRIYEKELIKVITFKEYIESHDENFLNIKLESDFEELIDIFVGYLLEIYGIDQEEYLAKQKKVYAIGNGYLSKDTIKWIKNFNINGNADNPNEMKRFAYRCADVGIFDEDIINILYVKLIPEIDKQYLEDELYELNTREDNKMSAVNLKDFLKRTS